MPSTGAGPVVVLRGGAGHVPNPRTNMRVWPDERCATLSRPLRRCCTFDGMRLKNLGVARHRRHSHEDNAVRQLLNGAIIEAM